jgi:hypothetical protein
MAPSLLKEIKYSKPISVSGSSTAFIQTIKPHHNFLKNLLLIDIS